MKKNMGNGERFFRFMLAVIVAVLYVFRVISGTLAIVLGVLAVMWLITGLTGFCPLYKLIRAPHSRN